MKTKKEIQSKNKDKKEKSTESKILKIFEKLFEKVLSLKILPEAIYTRLKTLPLRQKIQIIIVNSSFPILTILFIVFVILTITTFSNMKTDLTTRSVAIENSYQYYKNQLKVYAKIISNDSSIKKELISNTINAKRIQTVVSPLLKELQLNQINIYNSKGVVLFKAQNTSDFGQDEIKYFYIYDALNKGKSNYLITKVKNEYRIIYVSPIYFDQEIIGVTTLGYNFDYCFAKKLQKISGTHLFFKVKDNIISSSYGKIKNIIPYNDSYWMKIKIQKKTGKNKTYYLDHKSVNISSVNSNKKKIDLSIVLTVNNFKTQISLFVTVFIAVILSLIALLLSISTAVNVASFINHGVNNLQNGIIRIMEGNLTHKIQKYSNDEFGELANSFNNMGTALKSSQENLKKLNEIGLELSALLKLDKLLIKSIKMALEIVDLESLFIIDSMNKEEFKIIASNIEEDQDKIIYQEEITALSEKENTSAKIRFKNSSSQEYVSLIKFTLLDNEKMQRFLIAGSQKNLEDYELEIIESIARQIQISTGNIKKLQLETEIKTASVVQETLIPQNMPKVLGLEVYGIMHPAKGIGGDYFDFIPSETVMIDEKEYATKIWLMLGDVSGKGVPAGLIMVMVRTFLHSLAQMQKSVLKMLMGLNNFIYENSDESKFMTAVLAKWDVETGIIQLTGAGHETVLIYKSQKDEVEEFNAGGTILGISLEHDIIDMFEEHVIQLDENDFILIFTDGVTEARNRQKEDYGLEKVKDIMFANKNESIETIIDNLYKHILDFMSGADPHDDTTIIGYKRTAITEVDATKIKDLEKLKKESNFEITSNASKNIETIEDYYTSLEQFQEALDSDNIQTAELKINSLLKNFYKEAEVYGKYGHLLLKKGSYRKAIKQYKKAIELNQNYIEAYNFMAHCYYYLNEKEDGIQILNKALELEPNNIMLQKNLERFSEKNHES